MDRVGRPVDPDEFARRLRLGTYPIPELLLYHDGDDRCGCLALSLSDLLVAGDTGGELARHDALQRLHECVRNHLGWHEPT